MNNLYDVLEVCLNEIENGAELDAVLLRYPDLADELRPILEASVNARSISVPEPSAEVIRRNRAKVLQRASQMREASAQPKATFTWLAPLRRVASALVMILVILASGTSLVGAASTSVPGDNLYGVKRSWEAMQLFFTFNARTRDALEVEHENERLDELKELFASGRSAEVSFSGLVINQGRDEWLVSGIPVVITSETDLPDEVVRDSSPVRVIGIAQADWSVLAQSILLLPPDASLPEVDEGNDNESGQQNDNRSGSGSDNEAPAVIVTTIPEVSNENANDESFNGILDVQNGEFWTINGESSDVSNAEIIGTPSVGADVKVDGYFDSQGRFIVTKIEFLEDNSNSGSGSNGNDNVNSNDNNSSNDNSNDDNSNDGGGGGGNGNENGDDNSGSGSDSGGGGDDNINDDR